MLQAWESGVCDMSPSGDYTSLWCLDPDVATIVDGDRLDMAGQFFVAIAAPFSTLGAAQAIGIVELEYDIEFYCPRLAAGAIERTAAKTVNGDQSSVPFKGTINTFAGIVVDSLAYLQANVTPETAPALAGAQAALKAFIKPLPITAAVHGDLGRLAPGVDPYPVQIPRPGLPPGNYRVRVAYGSNDSYFLSNPPFRFLQTTGVIEKGTAYYDGPSLTVPVSNGSPTLLCPTTNTIFPEFFEHVWEANFEFGVEVDRGFADVLYSVDSSAASGGAWLVELAVAGASYYVDGNTLSSEKRCAREKRESKEEKKKSSTPPKVVSCTPPVPSHPSVPPTSPPPDDDIVVVRRPAVSPAPRR